MEIEPILWKLLHVRAPEMHLAMEEAAYGLKDGVQVHVAFAALIRDEELLGRGHQPLQLSFASGEGRPEGLQPVQRKTPRRARFVPVKEA